MGDKESRHFDKAFIRRFVLDIRKLRNFQELSELSNDECPRDIVSVWAYQPRLLYLRGLRVVVSKLIGNARASVAGTTSREFTLFLCIPR